MSMNPKIRASLMAAAVAVCAFTAYLGSLNNGFIWDDPIVLDQQMVAFKSLHDIFVPPPNIPQYGIFYYRPLVISSYMIDKHFTGPRPSELPQGSINPFHLSVVIYHTIVTVLVFFLGRLMLRRRWWGEWAAFAGAMIFAVHPIHTESVCWMAGRSDVLAALGLVPAMILYLLGRERSSSPGNLAPLWFIAAAVFYLVGLWAKETGIAVLLALPLLDLIPLRAQARAEQRTAQGGVKPQQDSLVGKGKGKGKKGEREGRKGDRKGRTSGREAPPPAGPGVLWRYGPFAGATVVYWFMRRADLGRGKGRRGTLTDLLFAADLQEQKSKITETFLDLIGAVGFYLHKVFVPTSLNAFIADVPDDLLTRLVGLAGIIGAIALVWWTFRSIMGAIHGEELSGPRIGLALGTLFFATLAPSFAIAVFDISEAPVAERYLYIPSIAVCLGVPYLLGLLIERLNARSGRNAARAALSCVMAAGAVIFATFGYATFLRNEIWSEDRVFWEDAVAKAPQQGLPHLHLGLTYDRTHANTPEEQKKYNDMAEKEYLLALDEKHIVYDVEGRSIAWNNLANVYMEEDRYDKAEECFRNSFNMRPTYPTPYYGIGLLTYRRALNSLHAGDAQKAYQFMVGARGWLEKAIELNPRYVKAILLQGTVLMDLHDRRSSEYFQKVIDLMPGTAEAASAQRMLVKLREAPALNRQAAGAPGGGARVGATVPTPGAQPAGGQSSGARQSGPGQPANGIPNAGGKRGG